MSLQKQICVLLVCAAVFTGLIGCSQINGISAPDVEKIGAVDPNNLGCELYMGQEMYTNQYLLSNNGKYKLVLQSDGNLVLYVVQTNQVIWRSNTNGKPVVKAAMQDDGNFVLYNSADRPYWATNTYSWGDSYIVLQDDRNLVLYGQVFEAYYTGTHIVVTLVWKPLWASNTQI